MIGFPTSRLRGRLYSERLYFSMRIIAGEFRSRRLFTPPDDSVTRPIPDRVKESVFALLRGHIEGSEIFDAFAGTGAIGLEALSRGAKRVVFVEQSRQIAALLKQNIEHFGVQDRSELVNSDALGIGAISRCPSGVRVIFLDPPYPLVRDPLGWRRVVSAMQQLARNLTEDGFLVLRTPWPLFEDEPVEPEPLGAHRGWKKGKKGYKDEERRIKKGHWDVLLDAGATKKRGTPDPREARRGSRKPGAGAGPKGLREAGETPFGDEWEEMDLEDVMPTPEPDDAGAIPSAEAPVAPAPKPQKVIDVKVPGLRGPETHVYGSMAVHLYMRG